MNKQLINRVFFWISGFAILFLINLVVEFVILPNMGFDASPRNDIYFQLWWVGVVGWFLFGYPALLVFSRERRES